MRPASRRYELVVRPGIFADSTYGVYAVPESNERMEYQLDARFHSPETAAAAAAAYRAAVPALFVDSATRVESTRDVTFSHFLTGDAGAHRIRFTSELERRLSAPMVDLGVLSPARLVRLSPYALALLGFVFMWRSWSWSIPESVPVVGEWLSGHVLTAHEVAVALPYALLVATLSRLILAWSKSFGFAYLRQLVLTLVFKDGWRRNDFVKMIRHVAEEKGHGGFLKLFEAAEARTSEAVKRVKFASGKAGDAAIQVQKDLCTDEGFEAQVHALWFMEYERSYRATRIRFDPVSFIVETTRAKRRFETRVTKGEQEAYLLPVADLPGHPRRKGEGAVAVILAIGVQLLTIGIPLWKAFSIAPLQGWLSPVPWVLGAAVMVPVIVWNLQLMIGRRGLPKGMRLLDVSGDPPTFRPTL